jgi:hypothetical protein
VPTYCYRFQPEIESVDTVKQVTDLSFQKERKKKKARYMLLNLKPFPLLFHAAKKVQICDFGRHPNCRYVFKKNLTFKYL